jgi:two-component system, OmpR family, sensor histidine kinase KdpD
VAINPKTTIVKQSVYAALLVCLVSALCFLVADITGYRVVALILLVTVSISAILFEIRPVLLSAFLSALIWDFFFIPPRYTLHVRNAEDTLMLCMYFMIVIVNAVLTHKIRKAEKIAKQKEIQAGSVKLYNALFNSLSHELKTPIATILGASDSLLDKTNKLSEKDRQALLEEITLAAVRLNQQVENLLNMSRLGSGYLQPHYDWCDVSELIYAVLKRLEDKLQDHPVKVDIPNELPLYKLDSGLLDTVLYNLINNAATYTEPGTAIAISVNSTREVLGHFNYDDDKLNPERDATNKSILIEISDNGKGFPSEEIDRVFDRFYRLKYSKVGGTGLGLSIAKGFVEALKGTIHVHNNPEGGARFIIRIPAETADIQKEERNG